jgi:hypothetical protein
VSGDIEEFVRKLRADIARWQVELVEYEEDGATVIAGHIKDWIAYVEKVIADLGRS